MRIENLRHHKRGCAVHLLPEPYRSLAQGWQSRLVRQYPGRQGRPLTQEVRGLLAGLAKRLALNPHQCTSEWGRQMLARRGGIARHAQLRAQGEAAYKAFQRKANAASNAKRRRTKAGDQ